MLLNVLCKDGVTTKDLDRHPGLTRLFADILDFVFEFDYLKVQFNAIEIDEKSNYISIDTKPYVTK